MELVRQDFNSFNCEIAYYEVAYPDVEAQAKCLNRLCEKGVAGVVCSPMEGKPVYEALAALDAAHIPVVTVNSDLEDAPAAVFCRAGHGTVGQGGRTACRPSAGRKRADWRVVQPGKPAFGRTA